jgi:flagellar basal body rod protein FlgB
VSALSIIEQGIAVARQRAAVLASDAANASTPGFVAQDVTSEPRASSAGIRFAAILHDVRSGGSIGTLEYAMGAIAKNSVWYRALTGQVRAVLREFKTVAEESRR